MFSQGTTAMNMKANTGIPTQYTGFFDCAYKMLKHEGPVSFTRGFTASWIRFAPLTTIQLVSWELLRKWGGYDAV